MKAIPVLLAVFFIFSALDVVISRPLFGGGRWHGWEMGDGMSWFEEMASSLNSGYKQPMQNPLGTPMQGGGQPAQPKPEPAIKDVPDPAAQAGQTPGVAPEGPQNAVPQANPQPFMNSPQNLFSFLSNPYPGKTQYAMAPNQGQQNAFQPKNHPNAPPQPESPGSQPQQMPGQDAAFQAAPNPSAGGANSAFQPQPNPGFQNQKNHPFHGQTPGAYGPGQQYVVYQKPMLAELDYIDRLMRNFMF